MNHIVAWKSYVLTQNLPIEKYFLDISLLKQSIYGASESSN